MTWGWTLFYGFVYFSKCKKKKDTRVDMGAGLPVTKQTFLQKTDSRSKVTSTTVAPGCPQREAFSF